MEKSLEGKDKLLKQDCLKTLKEECLKNGLYEFALFLKGKEYPIYVVGGYVRDVFLGLPQEELGDIDLCSCAKISDLQSLAQEGKFEIQILNKKLGVCKIKIAGVWFEHATFRVEKCGLNGKHSPTSVNFTTDINEDVLRRDFTINSLYYDICEGKIVDLVGGASDLKNRVLKTVGNPDLRIKEDAERILRAVRFALDFNLEIEQNLEKAIKDNMELLKNISLERLSREYAKIMKIIYFGAKQILQLEVANELKRKGNGTGVGNKEKCKNCQQNVKNGNIFNKNCNFNQKFISGRKSDDVILKVLLFRFSLQGVDTDEDF